MCGKEKNQKKILKVALICLKQMIRKRANIWDKAVLKPTCYRFLLLPYYLSGEKWKTFVSFAFFDILFPFFLMKKIKYSSKKMNVQSQSQTDDEKKETKNLWSLVFSRQSFFFVPQTGVFQQLYFKICRFSVFLK